MNIQDNVIRNALKNVYFVCGNACAGKSTIARMIADRHGFELYDMDARYECHRAIALPEYQPNMCYHMQDFHEQWTRPADKQAQWNMASLDEQTDMVFIDLMRIAADRPVVADVLFSPAYTRATVDYNRFVFLTVDKSVLRPCYFERPEKLGFRDFVRRQELHQTYFENIFAGLELTNEIEQRAMRASGLKMIERTPDMKPEDMLELVERHFRI